MVSLHLDTDLGGDIDDLCALAMLLNWPDLNLVGITTVAEHLGKRAGYVQYALDLAGRNDISVTAGADASLGVYRSWPALPDERRYWHEPVAPKPANLDEALSLIESSIEKGAIVAAIGPYTNLALLERRRPGILRGAPICVMGGYLFPPRHGFPGWNHEMDYNAQVDAESALVVFQRSAPTLVPIAVTAETSFRRMHMEALKRSARPLAQLIARQAEVFAEDEKFEAVYGARYSRVPDDIINFQHDPLACAIALGWTEGVEIQELGVKSQIEDGWLRQSVAASGHPMRVVTRVNGPAFSEFWLKMVAGAGT